MRVLKPSFAGFTLIEFVIVSIIIGIISVTLISYFTSADYAVLDFAAKKVSLDLSYGRQRAMVTMKPHKIYINMPDRLRIGFGNYTLITNPDNLTLYDIRLSKDYPGVSFFNNYSIFFDSLGRNKYMNVTSIRLSLGSKTKAIKIISETGKIYEQ